MVLVTVCQRVSETTPVYLTCVFRQEVHCVISLGHSQI